jgi:tropinone reductase I
MMKAWNLTGKTALVTGGSRGIGKAIVTELLALGAEVVFTARGSGEVVAVEQELKRLYPGVSGLTADVADAGHRQQMLECVEQKWGRLDILVNNAGINIRKASNDYTSTEFMQVLDINLVAPFELCRMLFPLLIKGNGASIINVSSVAGSFDVQTGAPYGMSKAGLIQLSRNLANEWASHGIRVNTVSPWFTETPLTSGLLSNPDRLQAITSKTPLRRIAHSEEMAAAVAFLAMDKSSYITGHNLIVDGGATIRLL